MNPLFHFIFTNAGCYERCTGGRSPVCIYDQNGKGYVINANFDGDLLLIDGLSGEVLDTMNVGSNVESSPAVYENRLVVGTRGQQIWGISFQ